MSAELYRCDSMTFEGGRVSVSIHGYPIVSHTKCGYWVDIYGHKKWVSNSSKKRFAYPTKAEAIKSFRARKNRQIVILKAQIEHCEAALELPEKDYLDCTLPFTDPLDRPILAGPPLNL